MERRTFLFAGAAYALPLRIDRPTSVESGQSRTAEQVVESLNQRISFVKSLHAKWRIDVIQAAGEGAEFLGGTHELLYTPERYRLVYQRGPFTLTELCTGPMFYKTIRKTEDGSYVRTEYEGKTPFHKVPAAMIRLLLPAPVPSQTTTELLGTDAGIVVQQGTAGRFALVLDAETGVVTESIEYREGQIPKIKWEFSRYRTDLEPPLPTRIVETRHRLAGELSVRLEWIFSEILLNGPVASDAFEWRVK